MKKLYLKGWEFNSYLIINELAKEVKKAGGHLVSNWKYEQEKTRIFNRLILEVLEENSKLLKGKSEEEIAKSEYARKKQEELEEYKKVNKSKIVYFYNYLNFELSGYIYYIQLNDNPFFPHYIIKEKCEKNTNNEYITKYQYYMKELKNDFLSCLNSFSYPLNKKQLKEVTKKLLNQITNDAESPIVYMEKYNNCYFCGGINYKKEKTEKKSVYKEIKLI